jgi:hypothetical protein
MRSFAKAAAVALALGPVGPVPAARAAKTPADNAELRRLMAEDQADRQPKTVDWAVVLPRDRARLARVKELYQTDVLRTAADYYHAALVLQHGEAPEDFLLAHELCVAAMVLGKNDRASSSLAAAAEDRFLMNIGRPQRFGTQFRSEGTGPMRLHAVGEGVSDELRRVMGVPPIADARRIEDELNTRPPVQ